jgi:ribonuclease G
MAKELFISTTPHETKVAVVEDEQLSEIYFERENEYTLAGSIYKGRVTRVLPGMQSAFVDIGLERDAFLYVTDFLEEQEDQEDFEQVPRTHAEAQQLRPVQQALGTEAASELEETHGNGGDQEQAGAQQLERTPRRWRGRRGRRRGRFQDQTQPLSYEQSQQGDAEGSEGLEVAESVLLPGESLSKYRSADRGAGEAVSAADEDAPAQSPAPPVSETPGAGRSYHPPLPDSSAPLSVLPGESISKYRNRDAGQSEAEAKLQPATSERLQSRSQSRWERPRRSFERESSQEQSVPLGPPVFALPGESLAKYRRPECANVEPAEAASETMQTESAPTVESAVQAADAQEHSVPEAHPWAANAEMERHFDAHVQVSRPEETDVEERIERVMHDVHPTHESASSTARFEVEAQSFPDPDEPLFAQMQSTSIPHEFGAGVVEEEEMEGEEADVSPFGEHPDEEIYDELEEETIESAEQLVEAVREAHVNQRLGIGQAEPADLDEHHAGEEVENLDDENVHESTEQLEAAGADGASYDEQEGEEDIEGPEGEEIEGNGRAELRASAGTAPFQQRTERTDRVPDRFRRGRRGRPMRGRRNIQRESQPTISELLKEGQEILVQIAKEPIAKKGARITSHIALPGRFLVYMPTVNHVGVSRKIGSDEERQRLKRILISEKGNAHGGFIVRTAAAGASEEDLRSDLRFLINLWNDIKSRSENGKAPALIYHDLNLVERILRDQVTSNFTSIWVDSEQEYERIVRFLGRFQPGMVRRAKLYTKETPLFEQFGIQEEINNALKSRVWLKSGGYIVINQTEALVAIDVNTGKYVGKTTRLEDTIVKTNTDAIREIVRQIRLRDLGGIIVIDFIDMDERKNRQKVMQALEEALKNDRAPSKVLQFNDFGLVAITRKRVKQSLERTLSTACNYCSGTGMIKSVQTVCNEIYVEMRKMSKHFEQRDVMLRVNPEVVKALKTNNARWLQEMEELTGKTIIVKSDPLLHQEQFDIN